ncbi:DUF4079 family protein [Desulfovibrio cuneatus]|uniref:DUF4079 family protein n=1 Tax=Desulfovibrio cuneatus TaxID=159728 RepID=UPI00040D0D48|nr:DUF4079 family protein [Desulfovibrio cuneatus]
MVYWIHPVFQVVATLLGLYALYFGWQRPRCSHVGCTVAFPWKKHVRLGRWAIALWLVGGLVGVAVVRLEWGGFGVTDAHATIGYAFLVLALVGYGTGHVLDKVKKRRTVLPIVHGVVNALLVLAALVQVWTGYSFLP